VSPGAAPGPHVHRPAPAARKAEVSRALATIADQVAQLPEPYVRALQPVLLQAQAEIARDLKAWLATAPDGEARFTAQHYRNALLQTRHALETMEKRVPIGVEGTLRAMGVASGEMATRHLQEEVAVFAGVFGHSVRPVQIQQAAIIAEGREQLIPRFRASARRYGKDIAGDVRQQLALGVARGETFAQLTDRLQRHGGPRGIVSLAGVLGEPGSRSEYIAEGLFAKYRGWAARVVRTETNHAYNAHALIGLEQMNEDDPGYQKRWDATNDLKTCEICGRLDGVIVDLDKPFPGVGVMHPPAHPNDRCGTTPWRPEWAKPPSAAPQPVIEVAPPPPDVEAEKRRAAEEAARRKAEQERAAAARRETEDDRRDQERRAAMQRDAQQRAERDRALEAEMRQRDAARQEAAAKAERDRFADLERQQRESAARGAAEAKRVADQLAKEAAERAKASAKEAERERAEAERRKSEEARAAETKRKADEAARLQREEEERQAAARMAEYRQRQAEQNARRQAEVERLREIELARLHALDAAQTAAVEARRREAASAAPPAVAAKSGGRTWQQAVDEMAATPMATAFHPRCDASWLTESKDWPEKKAKFEARMAEIFGKPITVEELTHGFQAPPGFKMKLMGIKVNADGHPTMDFRMADTTSSSSMAGKVASMTRTFHPYKGGGAVKHDLLEVNEAYQGKGIADHINGSALLRYQKWGATHATTEAAWVGRYAWARTGFSFKSAEVVEQMSGAWRAYAAKHGYAADVVAKGEKLLVEEPWTFAKWQEGNAKVGKGFLLDHETPVWHGHLPVGPDSPGWNNAAKLLKLETRE
jgi:SPP1 gp7 family putative phage head morphogenesis protein